VLLPLGSGGATVLDVLIDRVRGATFAETIVVATTTDAADDPIAAIAARARVGCVRGHATDLLDRHYAAAIAFGARHVVKIPSDCPLIDPSVIDEVIAWYLARTDRLDYASNLHPPTHPDGNDVEIMKMKTLAIAWREARRPFEREHTTPFVWTRPDRFRVGNVVWPMGDFSRTHRVVLDYREDYEVIRAVYDALAPSNPRFSALDVVRFLDANPDVAAINASRIGTAWYNAHRAELPGLDGPSASSAPSSSPGPSSNELRAR